MTPADLKDARHALGWSQTRLAEELGVSRRIVQYWESGEQEIPRAIDLAVAYLLIG